MSDAFSFGGITLTTKKKNLDLDRENPILFQKQQGNAKHVLFLMETFVESKRLEVFKKWVEKHLPRFDYTIYSASDVRADIEKIKSEGITKFYLQHSTPFEGQIIEGQTVVVTVGAALQALIEGSDLHVSCFYDFIFNKTYFYSNRTNTYIFPIDSIDQLIGLKKYGYMPLKASRASFAEMQLRKIFQNYESLKSPETPTRVKLVKLQSKEEVNSFLMDNMERKEMTWDLETGGFDFINHPVGCVTCSFDGVTGYYLPWKWVDLELFNKFLSTKHQVGQNLKFDIKFMKAQGITAGYPHDDTMVMAQTLNEFRYNGLKSLAYYYTTHGGYDKDLDEFMRKFKPKTYLHIPEDILFKYATMDAIVNFQVYMKMKKQFEDIDRDFPPEEGKWSVSDYYKKIRMPAYRSFIDIEYRGIFINKPLWDKNSETVSLKINELKKELAEELKLSETLNKTGLTPVSMGSFVDEVFDEIDEDENKELQSTMKLGKILERLGWSDQGRSKSGYYLTGDDQLSRWANEGHVEADKLKTLRAYRTLQKTFLGMKDSNVGWRAHLKHHKEDDTYRVHPGYRVMGTESGRNACVEPNFQQIPSSSIGAKLFKEVLYVPDPEEYYMVTMDYASLQMRLAAIDSEDTTLFNSYRENPDVDIHTKTGYNVFASGGSFPIEELIVDDGRGNKHILFPFEEINILRNGKKTRIIAEDLKETDELLV